MQIHLVSLDSRTLGEVWKEEEGEKECKGREGVGKGDGEEGAEEQTWNLSKKITRPNFQAKEFYTLKNRKSRLFLPAIKYI